MRAPEHGGDLDWARARFPDFTGEWLDLSTGISPFPWPTPGLADDSFRRLPSAADLEALCAAAAAAYGAPDSRWVAAAPGAQAAIQTLARLRPPCRVAIAGPTYGGHAAAWAAAGHEILPVPFANDGPPPGCSVAVVVTPNNPDGRLAPPERLRARVPPGGWLIIDESFADAAPEACARPIPRGTIVLRSFGKFYGLPGLRLGFALAEPAVAARLRQAFGPWPVSGPAVAIGRAALADAAWRDSARARLAAAARRLDRILARLGCETLGGVSLFRYVRAPAGLFDRLGARGVYARAFADRPDRLRFGLPGAGEARLASLAGEGGQRAQAGGFGRDLDRAEHVAGRAAEAASRQPDDSAGGDRRAGNDRGGGDRAERRDA